MSGFNIDKVDIKDDLIFLLKNTEEPLNKSELIELITDLNPESAHQGGLVLSKNIKTQLDLLIEQKLVQAIHLKARHIINYRWINK